MSFARLPDDARRMQAAVLRSIRSDLDLVVAPELVSGQARMALQLASEMLAFIELAGSEYPALGHGAEQRLSEILGNARRLSRQAGLDLADAKPQPTVASELMTMRPFPRCRPSSRSSFHCCSMCATRLRPRCNRTWPC
ncbi:MAG: hypothetical protein IPL00_18145 [Gammaproteobacteria bacterium]|nr:hypothetical protein [Gammaproteobacteria bacterium]